MTKRYINPDEKWELLKKEILNKIDAIDKGNEFYEELTYYWWQDMMEVKELILSQNK